MSTQKSAAEARYSAPALEKGLDVLELLAAEPHGLNLQDIARRLDKRLEEIRKRGYDEGPSDTVSGVVDICFPIFDHFGAVAALNIVYLGGREHPCLAVVPALAVRRRFQPGN